jgi:hypothetical protein
MQPVSRTTDQLRDRSHSNTVGLMHQDLINYPPKCTVSEPIADDVENFPFRAVGYRTRRGPGRFRPTGLKPWSPRWPEDVGEHCWSELPNNDNLRVDPIPGSR